MAKTGFWLRGGSAGISTLNNQYLNNAGQGSVLQSGSGTAGLVIPKTAVHLPQKAQKTQKFNPHTEAQSTQRLAQRTLHSPEACISCPKSNQVFQVFFLQTSVRLCDSV